MNRTRRLAVVALWVWFVPLGCVDQNATDSTSTEQGGVEESTAALSTGQPLLDAFSASLKDDLLTPYYPAAHDGSYGGFVEDRSGTWAIQQDSDKFIAFQARLIWTAAKASQFYASDATKAAQYLASAGVGYQFLAKMWRDSANGFGLMVDRNGSNPRNTGKEAYIVYGNAFGMYAAAVYYSVTGNASALTLAINAYNYLNTYFWDPQYGGYYLTATDKRKETNTNVHAIEALIELYNDLPASHALRSDVASRLSTLLARFHDYAMHCPATNDCFAYPVMNQDWTASTSDVSFGHDLELSMLMVQAISALGQDPLASPYITKIKKVVDFTFSHGGYRSDGGFYYTGTYNSGTISINDSQLQWWPQAEGLGALCLMRKLFPSDTSYDPLISKSWGFINTQVIDHTNHGWVRQANDWTIAKGWEWHCNYHNSRALMNCLNWLGGPCTPTTCSALGATCGTPSNGCGGTLSCGTCPTGQTCNASYHCVTTTNTAPVVNAGADRTVTLPSTLPIAGTVTDDGLPTPPALTITWSKTSGPGTATFSPANATTTTVTFSVAGTYVLRLTASDGALSAYDEVQVTVSNAGASPCASICTSPTSFTMNGSYSSGNLGTGVVCRQTTSAVRGGNCGNFASSRTLSVNGTKMTCNGGNWSSLPAARNGGYCISTTSGDYAWAYFSLW
ncbi:MAG TPA: AGE family epimerase/isomerase, partial [Polyangia bacterium]